jgi:hypothetical protein
MGVLLTAFGYFVRLRVLESPVFAHAKAESPGAQPAHPRGAEASPTQRVSVNGSATGGECFLLFTVWVLSYGTQPGDLFAFPRIPVPVARLKPENTGL